VRAAEEGEFRTGQALSDPPGSGDPDSETRTQNPGPRDPDPEIRTRVEPPEPALFVPTPHDPERTEASPSLTIPRDLCVT
jgi:hypothetical protein